MSDYNPAFRMGVGVVCEFYMQHYHKIPIRCALRGAVRVPAQSVDKSLTDLCRLTVHIIAVLTSGRLRRYLDLALESGLVAFESVRGALIINRQSHRNTGV